MARKNSEDVIDAVASKANGAEGSASKKSANPITIGAEKLKALQLTLDKLEKTYGKGTV